MKKIPGSLFFIISALLIVISRWADVQFPLNVKRIIDGISQVNVIIPYLILLAFNIVLIITAESFFQLTKTKFTNKIGGYYRKHILGSLLHKEIQTFTSKKRAEYISIMNNDIQMVLDDYYGNQLNIIQGIAVIIFAVCALINLNGYLLLIIVFQILLLSINPILFQKALQRCKENQSESKKIYNFRFTDFIEGIHIIKTYLCECAMRKKVDAASEEVNAAQFSFTKMQMYANLFSMTVGYACNFLVIGMGVYFIYMGKLTVGSLLAILQITDLLANPVTTLSYYVNAVLAAKPIKQKLDQLVLAKDSESRKCETMDIKSISLENVSLTIEQHKILKNINLSFESGKKYLLIGDNGSGKSTLMKLIYQLYDHFEGRFLINGIEIDRENKFGFYSKVAMVFQDNYIFAESLRDNITLFEEYPHELVTKYIDMFGLRKLDGEILSMNHLSGGEKQKIAIARALIRNPQILLLDEATSALDIEGQQQIERMLLKEKCCILHISHRSYEGVSREYDEVIYMRDGRIIENEGFQY